MFALIILAVIAVWFVIALGLALVIGRGIKIADQRQVRISVKVPELV